MSAEENLTEPQCPPTWRKLFKTPEGRILLWGVALALAGLIAMLAVSHWSTETSRVIGAMTFASISVGRTVSMSIGYADGYGYGLAVLVNIWAETVMVLLFYPVFVLSMRKLVVFPRLALTLEKTRAAAERHHDAVRRYGVVGLFIFVFVPFWLTGPLVGCAIGYLIGFSARLTLWVVLVSTYFATAGWGYLLFALYDRVTGLAPWASVLVVGIMTIMIVASYLLNRRGKKAKPRGKKTKP